MKTCHWNNSRKKVKLPEELRVTDTTTPNYLLEMIIQKRRGTHNLCIIRQLYGNHILINHV